jgi:hypothetical protein
VAVGVPHDIFYYGNIYYLYRDSRWYRGDYYNGPWRHVERRSLPPGLRKHKFERIRHYRDEEYRRYRDHDHYRGRHFKPDKEWKEGRKEHRREEKEQRKAEKRYEKEERGHGRGEGHGEGRGHGRGHGRDD